MARGVAADRCGAPIRDRRAGGGFSGPALFALADGGYGTRREVEAIFAQALIEMGRSPLTEQEAAMQAAWCVCEDIASGVAKPYCSARLIEQLRDYEQVHQLFAALIYFEEINVDRDGRSGGYAEEIRQLAREMVAGRGTVGG